MSAKLLTEVPGFVSNSFRAAVILFRLYVTFLFGVLVIVGSSHCSMMPMLRRSSSQSKIRVANSFNCLFSSFTLLLPHSD